MLRDRVKPNRRAPGSSGCGTPSITSILFRAQLFLWEATQQLRLAVFPLHLSRRTSDCRHHLFVLALAHPFVLPPPSRICLKKNRKPCMRTAHPHVFLPLWWTIAPSRWLIVLCFERSGSLSSCVSLLVMLSRGAAAAPFRPEVNTLHGDGWRWCSSRFHVTELSSAALQLRQNRKLESLLFPSPPALPLHPVIQPDYFSL